MAIAVSKVFVSSLYFTEDMVVEATKLFESGDYTRAVFDREIINGCDIMYKPPLNIYSIESKLVYIHTCLLLNGHHHNQVSPDHGNRGRGPIREALRCRTTSRGEVYLPLSPLKHPHGGVEWRERRRHNLPGIHCHYCPLPVAGQRQIGHSRYEPVVLSGPGDAPSVGIQSTHTIEGILCSLERHNDCPIAESDGGVLTSSEDGSFRPHHHVRGVDHPHPTGDMAVALFVHLHHVAVLALGDSGRGPHAVPQALGTAEPVYGIASLSADPVGLEGGGGATADLHHQLLVADADAGVGTHVLVSGGDCVLEQDDRFCESLNIIRIRTSLQELNTGSQWLTLSTQHVEF